MDSLIGLRHRLQKDLGRCPFLCVFLVSHGESQRLNMDVGILKEWILHRQFLFN